MSLSRFISQRLLVAPNKGNSRPIVLIAKGGILIGMILMIISIGVVNGFQDEIQQKMVGFNGHLQILSQSNQGGDGQIPFERNSDLEKKIASIPGVKKISPSVHTPVLLESKTELQGGIAKGVDANADTLFLHGILKQGHWPKWDVVDTSNQLEIALSSYQLKQLHVALNDKISIYFLNGHEIPLQQNFTIVGVYDTGLEEFDRQIVFIPIFKALKYSKFGLQVNIGVQQDHHNPANILVYPEIQGRKSEITCHWNFLNHPAAPEDTFALNNQHKEPVTIQLIVQDESQRLTDSAFLQLPWVDTLSMGSNPSKANHYIGAYEIYLENMSQLAAVETEVFNQIPFYLTTESVIEKNPELIAWLGMLDINVIIIIAMMVSIGIINMTSALLIIILEKQKMVGILRTMGMQGKSIMMIFLRQSVSIIMQGMLLGNVIALGLLGIQKQFALVKVDPQQYFVSVVPVSFNWTSLLLLNISVLTVCLLAMIIPAYYSTKIRPIKALRFN
jgi:lipoprotein-releasing system permease protein